MKKLLLFSLLLSVVSFAQKVELITLNQNIKDKKNFVKELTLIDARKDKTIGSIADKNEIAEIEFADKNLPEYFEKWFLANNKTTGNNDIVIMLEELKVYNEQDKNKTFPYAKAKIKISGFLKRSDRYYFINRFDNVIVCNPKIVSHPQKYLAQQISDTISEFILVTYSGLVTSFYVPENEITNYHDYLIKNNKSLIKTVLENGVYTNFKTFYNQEPNYSYNIEKNKKGEVVRLKKDQVVVPFSEMYCYVEDGIAYKLTPVGFDKMQKNDRGFYIHTSRVNLFSESKTGGMIVGAITGGVVGALIGAAIHSESNGTNGAVNGIGFRSTEESDVYIDSLTGAYIFER